MAERRVFRVIFHNQGHVYEIYAKNVGQGSLFGFVEVEQVLFGERSQVVVDPSEDRLKNEFKDVERFYVPLHAVIRIDQVERQGVSRITAQGKGEGEGEGTVSYFPATVHGPRKDPSKP